MLHPCETIYRIGANSLTYGNVPGVCRITGKQAVGLPFWSWVKDTFTNHDFLFPGDIISNEALFCFDEKSVVIQQKNQRDKPQKFRTYSHIIDADNNWHCVTKGDKELIFDFICAGATLVCLTDTGQKHLLFKHTPGMWQLDDLHIIPDIESFRFLHSNMCALLDLGFSQAEVISGNYLQYRILRAGLPVWKQLEDSIKNYRGIPLFNFASWLLFTKK